MVSLLSVVLGAILGLAETEAAPSACGVDYAAIKAEEIVVIDRGVRIYAQVHPDARTPEQVAQMEAAFALLADRERPVDQIDIAVLERALELLSSESIWNRQDDRNCADDGELLSIFCALQRASHDVTGEYQHRRTALQEVRFVIAERSQGREYAHRMQDYNNDPDTSFADARSALAEALAVVQARLEQQGRCELLP